MQTVDFLSPGICVSALQSAGTTLCTKILRAAPASRFPLQNHTLRWGWGTAAETRTPATSCPRANLRRSLDTPPKPACPNCMRQRTPERPLWSESSQHLCVSTLPEERLSTRDPSSAPWSKAVSPPLEVEMRGTRGRPRSWAHPSRRPPVMRSARPALLHRGRESLSHVLQLEIHSLPESVWTLPSLFPWSVSTAHGRGIACGAFLPGTKWLTCAHTGGRRWTGWAFLQNEDEWFWQKCTALRGKICDLRYSLRLCYGAPLLFCPFALLLAWSLSLRPGGTSQGPTQWWVHRRSRAPKTRAATESAPV